MKAMPQPVAFFTDLVGLDADYTDFFCGLCGWGCKVGILANSATGWACLKLLHNTPFIRSYHGTMIAGSSL